MHVFVYASEKMAAEGPHAVHTIRMEGRRTLTASSGLRVCAARSETSEAAEGVDMDSGGRSAGEQVWCQCTCRWLTLEQSSRQLTRQISQPQFVVLHLHLGDPAPSAVPPDHHGPGMTSPLAYRAGVISFKGGRRG